MATCDIHNIYTLEQVGHTIIELQCPREFKCDYSSVHNISDSDIFIYSNSYI